MIQRKRQQDDKLQKNALDILSDPIKCTRRTLPKIHSSLFLRPRPINIVNHVLIDTKYVCIWIDTSN